MIMYQKIICQEECVRGRFFDTLQEYIFILLNRCQRLKELVFFNLTFYGSRKSFNLLTFKKYSCFPSIYFLIITKSILNFSTAFSECGLFAGIIIISPSFTVNGFPDIETSAQPSIILTKASNGAVC